MTHFTDIGGTTWLGAGDINFKMRDFRYGGEILSIIRVFQDIGYVAGGAARYLLVPGAPEPEDIDVFLYGDTMDVSPLYRLGYTAAQVEPESQQAPFYTSSTTRLRVQVIRPSPDSTYRKSFGPPLEVLSGFTFHTEQAALWYGAGGPAGLLSVRGREATEDRKLTNNCISNPILSLLRINKYGRKGYFISMKSLLEIVSVLREETDDEYDATVTRAVAMESSPPRGAYDIVLEGSGEDLPF